MNPKTTTVVEGMKFVIMLAFGHPKSDQLRKTLAQIADQADSRLEPAWCALIAFAFYPAIIIVRSKEELLIKELPGYGE